MTVPVGYSLPHHREKFRARDHLCETFYSSRAPRCSVKAKGKRFNMSIEALARSEARRRVARVERARVRWCWLLATISMRKRRSSRALSGRRSELGCWLRERSDLVRNTGCFAGKMSALSSLPARAWRAISAAHLRRHTSARQQGQGALRTNGERCRCRIHAATIHRSGATRRAAQRRRSHATARLVLTRRAADRKLDLSR